MVREYQIYDVFGEPMSILDGQTRYEPQGFPVDQTVRFAKEAEDCIVAEYRLEQFREWVDEMVERAGIDWHVINDERGLAWMKFYLPTAPYSAFTTDHRDRRGQRIYIVGDPANPADNIGFVKAKLAFRFGSDELADAGQKLLETHKKSTTEAN